MRSKRLVFTVGSWLLVGAALVYLGLSWFIADRLSRPERHHSAVTPDEVGLVYEPVGFESLEDRLRLRGWWMRSPNSERAVILVHGRNSNRSGIEPATGSDGGLLRQAKGLVQRGYNVLAFDLRGHGESDGDRCSLGPHERRDVLGAVAYVQSRGIPPEAIGLLCHSMGAATCLLAAREAPNLAGIVADSSYARLTDLLVVELPKASGLPAFFNPGILLMHKLIYGIDLSKAAPIDVVSELEPPLLFIHSESDATIPSEHSRRLWRAAGQAAETLWLVNGPDHNRIFESDPDRYVERVVGFLEHSVNQVLFDRGVRG